MPCTRTPRPSGSGTEQVIPAGAGPLGSKERVARRFPPSSKRQSGRGHRSQMETSTDTFLLQPSTAPAAAEALETDATFAWAREEGRKEHHTMPSAKQRTLKANGTVLLQSDEPQTEAKER